MPSVRHQLLKQLARIFDLAALVCSFVFAVIMSDLSSRNVTFARLMGLRITLANCLIFALLLITWRCILSLCGLYVSKRFASRRAEILDVCRATLCASALLPLFAKIFHLGIVKLTFVLIFWFCCTWLMVSARLVARPVLAMVRRRGKNGRFVLIFGTNDRALKFAAQITERPERGYRIVGFVDDDWAGIRRLEAAGHTRCCDFKGLAEFLRHNVVDEAAVYLPLASYYIHAAQLVSQCEQHGITIRFDTHIFNVRGAHLQTIDIDEQASFLTASSPSSFWPLALKRIIDFTLSAILLFLLAPFLALVAILIKVSSPGPVLFSQVRIGLNKRQFRMYKFRTMVAAAERMQSQLLSMNEMTGPVFKMKNDPRVTRLGRILRKTSIDELPQLVNVFKGDMSMVGPRAMSLRDYQLFEQDWQRRRFSVKPGITCLWQIRGRNAIPFEQWMELDMQYIDKWSIWLDLEILARTVPAVLRGTGAA